MSSVGLDVDGVLLDWQAGFSETIMDLHGVTLTPEDFQHWHLRDYPTLQSIGLSHQDIRAAVEEYLSRPWGYLVDVNAPSILVELRETLDVQIRTNREPRHQQPTLTALADHGIHFEDGVFDKHGPKHGYDALIDDLPHHVTTNAMAGGIGLLFNQPWNRDAEPTENVHRVISFKEVAEHLHAFAGA